MKRNKSLLPFLPAILIVVISVFGVFGSQIATGQTIQNWQALLDSSNQQMAQYQNMVQSQNQNATGNQDRVAEGAILFVSLGMPKLALQQYIRQAKIYHVPLVIRGLLQNDYQLTTKTLYEVLHPENQTPLDGGVEIDPLWFKEFNIIAVPALVVATSQSYAVVYGNIPISQSLRLIAQKSLNPGVQSLAQQTLREATYVPQH